MSGRVYKYLFWVLFGINMFFWFCFGIWFWEMKFRVLIMGGHNNLDQRLRQLESKTEKTTTALEDLLRESEDKKIKETNK